MTTGVNVGTRAGRPLPGSATPDWTQGLPDAIDPPYEGGGVGGVARDFGFLRSQESVSPYAASSNTATENHTIPGSGSGNAYVDAIIWGNSGWYTNTGPITYWFGSSADSNNPGGTLDGLACPHLVARVRS